MEYNEREIQQAVDDLPNNIRNAVENFNWEPIIQEIREKFKLHIDDIAAFREQSMLVIIGELPADRYIDALIDEIGLDKEVANELAELADEKVFRELQRQAFKNSPTPESERVSVQQENYQVQSPRDPYAIIDINDNDHDRFKESHQKILKTEPSQKINTALQRDLEQQLSSSSWKPRDPGKKPEPGTENFTLPPLPQKTTADYREPIESSDLRGIPSMAPDTSILKTAEQLTPDQAFSKSVSPLREKTNNNNHLGTTILNTAFIPKPDILDLSEEDETEIPQEMIHPGFLNQLGNIPNQDINNQL